MELNKLSFLKYLTSDKKNLYYVEGFFSSNSQIYQVLQEYDRISYTDDLTKFFFLYRNRELLLQKFEDWFEEKKLHIHSVVRFLFASDRFPLSSNVVFEYELNDEKDVALYLNLYYLIEIFIILERIVLTNDLYYFYKCYNREERPSFLHSPYFINSSELLKIAPFLFDNEKISRLIKEDLETLKVEIEEISAIGVLRKNIDLKLNAVVEEIMRRTNVSHVKLLNPFYLRDNISKPKEEEFSNISTFFSLYGKENKWNKFKIDSNFIYGKDLISIEVDFKAPILFDEIKSFGYSFVDLEEFYPSSEVGKKNDEMHTEHRISEIESKQNQLVHSTTLRNCLKINVEFKKVHKLFDGLVDKVFLDKKELKSEFRNLFGFLADNSIIEFPISKSLEIKDVKYIMRFFSKYKGNEFDYKVSDLQYLLTHFAGMPKESKNSSIEKAHRLEEFDLEKEAQKQLNSLIR